MERINPSDNESSSVMLRTTIRILESSKQALEENRSYLQGNLVNMINSRFISASIESMHELLMACLDASLGEGERLRTMVGASASRPLTDVLIDGYTQFFTSAKSVLVCITELEKKGQLTHAMLEKWILDLKQS